MTYLKRVSIMVLLGLSLSLSIIAIGNMATTNTPAVLAVATADEVSLCIMLSTDIGTDTVDSGELQNCLWEMEKNHHL